MPRTPEAQAAWEQGCYGCSEMGLRAFVTNSTLDTPVSLVLSMLSDVQAMVEIGADREAIRQSINRAKFIIDQYTVPKP